MNAENGMEEIMKAKAIVGMHEGFLCPGCTTVGPCFRKLKSYPASKFIEEVKDLTLAAVREQQAGMPGGCTNAYVAVASLPHTMMTQICELEIVRQVAMFFCARAVLSEIPDASAEEVMLEFQKAYAELEAHEMEICENYGRQPACDLGKAEAAPVVDGPVQENKPEANAADGTK